MVLVHVCMYWVLQYIVHAECILTVCEYACTCAHVQCVVCKCVVHGILSVSVPISICPKIQGSLSHLLHSLPTHSNSSPGLPGDPIGIPPKMSTFPSCNFPFRGRLMKPPSIFCGPLPLILAKKCSCSQPQFVTLGIGLT